MRATATLAAGALLVGVLAGCTDEDVPGAEELAAIDTSPTVELVLDEGGEASVEVAVGAVLAIRNEDDVPHRLVAEDLDTGLLEPGDETLLLFDEPATIDFTDLEGTLTGSITVVPAPTP